ncbi:hypothetical protein P0082_10065 [Candidatus Haliotispira prima]|uniref:Uncharacterized protein n=1 Tax=Candidatus Haliotispira prima TaxID=3034016 RepID=A0ABY8MHY9_9SPIO|nr:hypothetical protein P0082_10065 [Candidatus Haliotispira prima]
MSFSATAVVSSAQLEMSSSFALSTIGAVIRLATATAPTKTEAEASAGYVSLAIAAGSPRKFSISQHYGSDFTDGLTLADVLTANTQYKLYLFFEANAIPSETTVEGATLNNNVVVLPFTTATLPLVGDAVWDNAWTNEQFVGSLSEWGYSENQYGVFVAYTKLNLNPTSIVLTARTTINTLSHSIGSSSIGNVIADPNFLFNIVELGGSYPHSSTYPNYYYVIAADDTKTMSGVAIRLEVANLSISVIPRALLTRYSNP